MNIVLLVVAIVFSSLAALVHVYIWVMESIRWTQPAIWKRFGIASQAEADTIKPMALNQGFYNLFLAAGVVLGFILLLSKQPSIGQALVVFSCASMVAASLVLLISNAKLARAALTQGLFPVLAVIAWIVADLTLTH